MNFFESLYNEECEKNFVLQEKISQLQKELRKKEWEIKRLSETVEALNLELITH